MFKNWKFILELEFYKLQGNIEEIFKSKFEYDSTKTYIITYSWYDGDNHNDDGSWEDYIIYELYEILN